MRWHPARRTGQFSPIKPYEEGPRTYQTAQNLRLQSCCVLAECTGPRLVTVRSSTWPSYPCLLRVLHQTNYLTPQSLVHGLTSYTLSYTPTWSKVAKYPSMELALHYSRSISQCLLGSYSQFVGDSKRILR